MSTYWDIVCLDCDDSAGLHINHGNERLRALVTKRDPLAALAGLADTDVDIDVIVSGERGYVRLEFFREHAGHVIAPVSEYGDIDGDCNESHEAQPGVSDGARCRLSEGHEGDHDFRLARQWEEAWGPIRIAAAARRRAKV